MNELALRWDEIKQTLKFEHDLSDVSYRTWIEPLKLHKVTDHTVYIYISLDSALEYISKKYTLPFTVIIAEVTGIEYEVRFVDATTVHGETKQVSESSVSNNSRIKSLEANLNPKYTFDTFVVGKNNEFAHAVSLAVAENPGELYNPLFLYGGVGLGKTHLMHSIAHFIIEDNPDMRVMYVTSETFTNELIDALRMGKTGNVNSMTKFRDKYRNIDVLLIDDIQFIIGKESTQEEFFHTFNDLYGRRKAIIISSDKPPKDFETLEDRYKSRFDWGLIADINLPDFETRMAILQKKVEIDHLEHFHIPQEVLAYIADNIKTNIRELEGSLNKLVAIAKLQGREINLELASHELRDMILPSSKREISPSYILDIVAEQYSVSIDDMKGPKRNAEIVIPRQVVMYLCRKLTNAKLTEIGDLLGGRDHSTIKHGVKTISDTLDTDFVLQNNVDILLKKLTPA